ncbi:hypothetical protein [Streptomyces sp. MMG1121]|uniref:hypothetical protein n=1 Tax=Streptomyces sp. MMG1121 TaxID=1415544 RepID=UPI00131CA64D|nr:hypothetical protein [Streptomyces sp. MMG1121]
MTFERALDKALNSQQVKDALDRSAALDREQLRTRALRARAAITGAAAVEYRAFLEVRAAAATSGRDDEVGLHRTGARGGGGLLPLLAVLVPGVAAAAAAALLVSGYGLRAFGGRLHVADGLITAGVIAAVVTAGVLIGDLVHVLVAAARNRSDDPADPQDGPAQDLPRAREEWELALLERGVIPFLLGRLEEATVTGRGGRRPR